MLQDFFWKKYLFWLIILTSILTLLEKAIFNSRIDLIITTFLFEFSIFILIYLAYWGLSKHNEIIAKIVFFVLFIWHTLSTIVSSYFLDDAFGRNYSYFGLNLNNVEFAMEFIVPWSYLFLILAVFAGLCFVAYWITKKTNWFFYLEEFFKKTKFILLCVLILLLLIIVLPFFSNNFDHIYSNTIKGLYIQTKNVPVIPDFNCSLNDAIVDKANYNVNSQNLKYNKIAIFVMEELSYKELNEDVQKLPENNFWQKTKANSNYYYNHYTNNQDSVPAMISMLSSKFIPYEAYIYTADFSPCAYNLFKEYNLVDFFNDLNFKTYFLASQTNAACELTKYHWSQVIDFGGSSEKYKDRFLCLSPYPYDDGCEDLALLDKVIDLLKEDKVFLMQEFIFGHNPDYMSKSKMSKTEYYNKFFEEYLKKVKEAGLDQNLLTVIVTDHGNKWINIYKEKQGYNVPLIFLANDLSFAEDNNFHTHLDFKDLLFGYLYNTEIPETKSTYFVGPTGSNTFGYMEDDSFFTINKNLDNYKIINKKLGQIKEEDVPKKLGCYLQYKQGFN